MWYLFILSVVFLQPIHILSLNETCWPRANNLTCVLNDLLYGYNKQLRPNHTGPIVELDMSFTMNLFFRQVWTDERLTLPNKISNVAVSTKLLSAIWKPDTYFLNSHSGYLHTTPTLNHLLRILENGRLLYSSRLTIKAYCSMFLRRYPLDVQTCSLILSSYAYGTRDVIYDWKLDEHNGVELERLKLSQFDLFSYKISKREIQLTDRNHSVLQLDLRMRRSVGFYVLQGYIPAGLLVILSWISFWIDSEATADRVYIGITSILSLTTLALDIRSHIPAVPYITAIDSFFIICYLFLLASLLQYTAVHRHLEYGHAINNTGGMNNLSESSKQQNMPIESRSSNLIVVRSSRTRKLRSLKHARRSTFAVVAQGLHFLRRKAPLHKLDRLARIGFPVLFVLCEATDISSANTATFTYDNNASRTTQATYATITSSLTLTPVSQTEVVVTSITSETSITQLTTTESPSSSTNFIGSIDNNTYASTLATTITMVAQNTFETTTVAESNVKSSTDENNSIVIITTTESQSTSGIVELTEDSNVTTTPSIASKVTESQITSQFEETDNTYITIPTTTETFSTSTVATFTSDTSNSDHSSISGIVRTDETTVQTQIGQGTSVFTMNLSESMISSTPANSMLETIIFTLSSSINATTATAQNNSTDKAGSDSSLSTVSMVDSLISSTVVTDLTQTSNDIFSSAIIPTRQSEITSKSQTNQNTLIPTTTVAGDIISLSSQAITINITVSTPEFSISSTINSSMTFDDLAMKDTSITSMTITQTLSSTVIPASIEDTFISYSTSSSSITGDTKTTAESQTYENTSLPSDTIVASMTSSTTLATAISASSFTPESRLTLTAQPTTTMNDQTAENRLISTTEANENSSSLTSEFSTTNTITSNIIPSRSAGIISDTQTTRTFDDINSSSTLPSVSDTTSTLVSSSTASSTLAAETTFDIATSGRTLDTNTMITESYALVTTTTTAYTPDLCRNSTQLALSNGTCVSYGVAQEYAATLVNSVNTSAIDLANALPLYISSTVNSSLSSNSNNTVSPSKINEVVDNVNNISIVVNSDSSLFMVQKINLNAQQVVVGASFQRMSGGSPITNTTQDSTFNGNLSAAALVSTESLVNIQSLTMFIIDKPTMYESIGNATNKSLASSIIVASVLRINPSSAAINISLYFQILPEYRPNATVIYSCSFYDINNSDWNETGCTVPILNIQFNRYECSCNHLTTFALTWSATQISETTSNVVSTNSITTLATDTSDSSTSLTLTSTFSTNKTNTEAIAIPTASTPEKITSNLPTPQSDTFLSIETTTPSSTIVSMVPSSAVHYISETTPSTNIATTETNSPLTPPAPVQTNHTQTAPTEAPVNTNLVTSITPTFGFSETSTTGAPTLSLTAPNTQTVAVISSSVSTSPNNEGTVITAAGISPEQVTPLTGTTVPSATSSTGTENSFSNIPITQTSNERSSPVTTLPNNAGTVTTATGISPEQVTPLTGTTGSSETTTNGTANSFSSIPITQTSNELSSPVTPSPHNAGTVTTAAGISPEQVTPLTGTTGYSATSSTGTENSFPSIPITQPSDELSSPVTTLPNNAGTVTTAAGISPEQVTPLTGATGSSATTTNGTANSFPNIPITQTSNERSSPVTILPDNAGTVTTAAGISPEQVTPLIGTTGYSATSSTGTDNSFSNIPITETSNELSSPVTTSPNNAGTVTTAAGISPEQVTPLIGTIGYRGTSSTGTENSFPSIPITQPSDELSSPVTASPNNGGTVTTAADISPEQVTPLIGTIGYRGTSSTGTENSFPNIPSTQTSNGNLLSVSISPNNMQTLTTGTGVTIEEVTWVTPTAPMNSTGISAVTIAPATSVDTETSVVPSATTASTLMNANALTSTLMTPIQLASSPTAGNVVVSTITTISRNVSSSTVSSTSGTALYVNTTSAVTATVQLSTPTTPTFSNSISSVISSTVLTTSSISIGSTSLVTTAATITTTISTYSPDACRNFSNVALANGTCVPYNVGQNYSAGIINNGSASSLDIANALSLYISSFSNANSSNSTNSILSASEIDNAVSRTNGISVTINSVNSFLIAQQLNQSSNNIVLGGTFQRGSGGNSVTDSTMNSSISTNFTVGAVISRESLRNVSSLEMFIIDKPTMYENIDNRTNKSLASSVVVGSVQPLGSATVSMNISLYLQISSEYRPNGTVTYLCSFYDISNSCWNETGCTVPVFNIEFNRYECSCNHLTAFALTWSAASVLETTSNLIATNPVTTIGTGTSGALTSSTLTSMSSTNSTITVTLATATPTTTEQTIKIATAVMPSTVNSTATTESFSTANGTATTVASTTANTTATTEAFSTAIMAAFTTANITATTAALITANSTITTEAISAGSTTAFSTTNSTAATPASTTANTTVTTEAITAGSTAAFSTTNSTATTAASTTANTTATTEAFSTAIMAAFTTANITATTAALITANSTITTEAISAGSTTAFSTTNSTAATPASTTANTTVTTEAITAASTASFSTATTATFSTTNSAATTEAFSTAIMAASTTANTTATTAALITENSTITTEAISAASTASFSTATTPASTTPNTIETTEAITAASTAAFSTTNSTATTPASTTPNTIETTDAIAAGSTAAFSTTNSTATTPASTTPNTIETTEVIAAGSTASFSTATKAAFSTTNSTATTPASTTPNTIETTEAITAASTASVSTATTVVFSTTNSTATTAASTTANTTVTTEAITAASTASFSTATTAAFSTTNSTAAFSTTNSTATTPASTTPNTIETTDALAAGSTAAFSTTNSTATTPTSTTANATATTVASTTASTTATMMASSTTNNIATTINYGDNTTEPVSSVQSTSSYTITNITGTAGSTAGITTVLITAAQSAASSTTGNLVASTIASGSNNISTLTASSTGQLMSSNSVSSTFSSAALTTASISIGSSSLVTTAATITTTISTYSPDACRNSSNVALANGTCVPYNVGQNYSAGIINNGSASSLDIANALSLYISSFSNANSSNSTNSILSASEIDNAVSRTNGISVTINSVNSFLIAQQLNQSSNNIVLGGTFQRGSGGNSVTDSTMNSSISTNFTVGAVISRESLRNVSSLEMFIIDKPSMYENVDNKTNKSLASSVVIGSVQPLGSASVPMNISLYFKISPEYQPNVSATYLCSFYDISNSRWNETGCTNPLFNPAFSRYECSCNHLTSFALIWLPQSQIGSYGRTMRAADIASLVFQSVSIVCFLIVIIHSVAIRAMNPLLKFQTNNLLPLISSASTTILFIFYIALGMTVYTQTPSEKETKCFLSSSVLMFFVYFFLIFMFCTKTSIGYFNYLRFVYLFPEPKLRQLYSLLIISFLVSITWVSFAAGFNANASFSITQLYPYQLCWFTHDVIYYFMTIPVCLFLLLNIFTIIFVSKHIIAHARNATTRHQSYERMKQCVLILLSSCVTQGIGWLFGPFISFVSPTGGDVLEWFFIIFNGLEGVWSIILYIIIQLQGMEEQKRVTAIVELTKTSSIGVSKGEKSSSKNARRKDNAERENSGIVERNIWQESVHGFDSINKTAHIHRSIDGSFRNDQFGDDNTI
ncbi:unnamed protein product [Rotaria socialis]